MFCIKNLLFSLLAITFLWSSCKEIPLEIPASTVGKRRVLVEEVTGVDCPNCPDGTAELAGLSGIYGENLVVVSVHGGDRGGFNKQLPGARYNFNIDKAEQLVQHIGTVSAFPTAAINRQVVNGNTDYFNNRPWKSAIEAEAQQDFGLILNLSNQYDPASRLLNVEVTMAPEQQLAGEHRITVYITQDSIIDPQNVYGQVVNDFVHRHVFRDILTNIEGNAITEPLAAGALITRQFSYTLPTDFDPKHCYVVAFVHHGGIPDKEVLQVIEKHVQ